jgi:hypothetical protein
MSQDTATLARRLRDSFPTLFPPYVDDGALLPLLRLLQAGPPRAGASADAGREPAAAAPAPPPLPAAKDAGAGVPSVIASIGDLQRVGPAALQAAKARMDVVFEAHKLVPGDDGYVYDVRADFAPTEESGWDD